jgi:hypothetical protein
MVHNSGIMMTNLHTGGQSQQSSTPPAKKKRSSSSSAPSALNGGNESDVTSNHSTVFVQRPQAKSASKGKPKQKKLPQAHGTVGNSSSIPAGDLLKQMNIHAAQFDNRREAYLKAQQKIADQITASTAQLKNLMVLQFQDEAKMKEFSWVRDTLGDLGDSVEG